MVKEIPNDCIPLFCHQSRERRLEAKPIAQIRFGGQFQFDWIAKIAEILRKMSCQFTNVVRITCACGSNSYTHAWPCEATLFVPVGVRFLTAIPWCDCKDLLP